MEAFLGRLDRFERETAGLSAIRRSDQSMIRKGRMKGFDRGKLLIAAKGGNIRGSILYREFLERYHLQPEMAGDTCVTAILTPWDREEGWSRLTGALWDLDRRIGLGQVQGEAGSLTKEAGNIPCPVPVRAVRLHEAVSAQKRLCPLKEAEGLTAGGYVNLYPPGIPLVIPGEVLDERILKLLEGYICQRLQVQGLERRSGGSEEGFLIPVLA